MALTAKDVSPPGTAVRFRPFSNPATGELVEFTAPTDGRDGDIVRFTWRSRCAPLLRPLGLPDELDLGADRLTPHRR